MLSRYNVSNSLQNNFCLQFSAKSKRRYLHSKGLGQPQAMETQRVSNRDRSKLLMANVSNLISNLIVRNRMRPIGYEECNSNDVQTQQAIYNITLSHLCVCVLRGIFIKHPRSLYTPRNTMCVYVRFLIPSRTNKKYYTTENQFYAQFQHCLFSDLSRHIYTYLYTLTNLLHVLIVLFCGATLHRWLHSSGKTG